MVDWSKITTHFTHKYIPKVFAAWDVGHFSITIVEEFIPEEIAPLDDEPLHSFYLSCGGYSKRMFSIKESDASEEIYLKLLDERLENEVEIFKEEFKDKDMSFIVLNL